MNSIISEALYSKQAVSEMSCLSLEDRNKSLLAIYNALLINKEKIFNANKIDMENAKKENLSIPLLKRLHFDENKLNTVLKGIKDIISLNDPLNNTLMCTELKSDLELYKVSCPIGLVGIIFESRPDAFIQIATLCLKSGNCAILKGGHEAENTNKSIYNIMINASRDSSLNTNWLKNINTREDVAEMLKLNGIIDLIIPRGSKNFVNYIIENSRIPVLGHSDGICHVYVDEYADIKKAIDVSIDSKTENTSVCNAIETLLVNENIAAQFLPLVYAEFKKLDTIVVGCEKTTKIIACEKAVNRDWDTEYLSSKISIKIVKDVNEAIKHISKHGSSHTDCIISEDESNISKFLHSIDSSGVYCNCSTRFADGYRYGFGAEVGISTSKIHSRGPMGLDGLTTYKYILLGNGQTITEMKTQNQEFTHKSLNKKCPYFK